MVSENCRQSLMVMEKLPHSDHVCILFGHIEANMEEFTVTIIFRIQDGYSSVNQEMYNKIETDDEGDITMRRVVEHIRAVEAGSGNNVWVRQSSAVQDIFNNNNNNNNNQVNSKLDRLAGETRQNNHVTLIEFLVS